MKLRTAIWKGVLTVWDYFRDSWEGTDHKFSYKRASQFAFMWLMILMVIRGITNEWDFKTFLVIAVLFALTAAVITVPELLLMMKYYKQNRRFDYWNGGNTTTTSDQNTETINDENETSTSSIDSSGDNSN